MDNKELHALNMELRQQLQFEILRRGLREAAKIAKEINDNSACERSVEDELNSWLSSIMNHKQSLK